MNLCVREQIIIIKSLNKLFMHYCSFSMILDNTETMVIERWLLVRTRSSFVLAGNNLANFSLSGNNPHLRHRFTTTVKGSDISAITLFRTWIVILYKYLLKEDLKCLTTARIFDTATGLKMQMVTHPSYYFSPSKFISRLHTTFLSTRYPKTDIYHRKLKINAYIFSILQSIILWDSKKKFFV